MVVMEAPIDWGSVETLPAPSEGCEASAAPPYERQVARAIPQRPSRGHGTPLLSQLLQQEPGPPGPHPPSSSSSESSDEGGPPGTGLWYEASGGRTMTMAAATVMALPAVPSEVACTRKVNTAHCILTCIRL